MPRTKSDKRTTLDKAMSLKGYIAHLCKSSVSSGFLPCGTGVKDVVELADMVIEEVEILLKCQYEMRKTIKSGTYGRKTDIQKP